MPTSWGRETVARSRVAGGAGDGDLVLSSDPRLSDARTPVDGSVTGSSIAAGAIGPGAFVAGSAPNRLVAALPTLPDTDWPAGSVVVLSSNAKVYRTADGASWSVATDGGDITALSITTAQIAALAITTAKIAADAVTAAEIAAGAVGNTELAAFAVTAAKITAGTITTSEIAAGTIVAGNIAALTITASQIAANTITAAKIAAATITTTEIAANTIVAGNIAAATITGAKIAANTITAGNITAGTITATELSANSVTAAKLATTIALVGGSISSTTYVAGTSGWSINADGTAEFGTVTIRGVLYGSSVVSADGSNINPNPSAVTNTTGWNATTNTTLSRRTGLSFNNGYEAVGATTGLRFTSTASGNMVATSDNIAVQPGRGYGVAAAEQSLLGTSSAFTIAIKWYQSDGTTLISTSATATAQFVGGASEWVVLFPGFANAPFMAPSNAAFAKIVLTVTGATAGSQTADLAGIKLATFASLDSSSLDIGWYDYPTNTTRLFSVKGASGFGVLTANCRTITLGENDTVSKLYMKGKVTTDDGATFAGSATSYGGAGSWTGATTNPTNRIWQGYYTVLNKKVDAWIFLTANTSFTVGSGAYIVALPVSIDNTVHPSNSSIGDWVATVSGANTAGVMRKQGTDAARFSKAAGGSFGSADGMAATDTLAAHVSYIAA